METEVVECGKSVVVLPSKLVQAEIEYLARNYPAANWFKSRESLQTEPIGIAFRNTGISKIPGYYKSLVEVGIYGRLNQEYYARKNFQRKRAGEWGMETLPDKMTMDGCISTLFIICAGVAGLAVFVFCGEGLQGRIVIVVVTYCRRVSKASRKNKLDLKPNQIKVSQVVNMS